MFAGCKALTSVLGTKRKDLNENTFLFFCKMGLILWSWGYPKDTGWCSRPVASTCVLRPLSSHIRYTAYHIFTFQFITIAKLEL